MDTPNLSGLVVGLITLQLVVCRPGPMVAPPEVPDIVRGRLSICACNSASDGGLVPRLNAKVTLSLVRSATAAALEAVGAPLAIRPFRGFAGLLGFRLGLPVVLERLRDAMEVPPV